MLNRSLIVYLHATFKSKARSQPKLDLTASGIGATGIGGRRWRTNRLHHAAQTLQLRQRHQAVGNQSLARRGGGSCHVIVVAVNKPREARRIDAATERAELGPRDGIPGGSVAGESPCRKISPGSPKLGATIALANGL